MDESRRDTYDEITEMIQDLTRRIFTTFGNTAETKHWYIELLESEVRVLRG